MAGGPQLIRVAIFCKVFVICYWKIQLQKKTQWSSPGTKVISVLRFRKKTKILTRRVWFPGRKAQPKGLYLSCEMCINFDIVRGLLQITPSLISLFRKVSSEVTRLLTPFECKSFLITAINGVGTTSAVCGPTAGNISVAKKSAFPSFLSLKFHIFRRVFNLPRPHTIKLQLDLTLHNTERLLCLAISSSKSAWAIKVRSVNDKLLLILALLFFWFTKTVGSSYTVG